MSAIGSKVLSGVTAKLAGSAADWVNNVCAALTQFSAERRLYAVEIEGVSAPLTLEAFSHHTGLHGVDELDLLVLSTDATLPMSTFTGHECRVWMRLADGSRVSLSGVVRAAQCVGAEGGLARYAVQAVSWPWLLSQSTHHRVFQDKSVLQIFSHVVAAYGEWAQWRMSDEVDSYVRGLANAVRPFTVQYRETDLAFVKRLLAECGLSFCMEEAASDASSTALNAGVLRLFADSTQWPASSQASVRFHRGDSQEARDAMQAIER